MKRIWIYGFVLLVAGLLVSACNSHTELPPDPQALIHAGKPLYIQQCAACHQTDGSGKPSKVPKLAGNPIVTLEDPIPVIKTVSMGKERCQNLEINSIPARLLRSSRISGPPGGTRRPRFQTARSRK